MGHYLRNILKVDSEVDQPSQALFLFGFTVRCNFSSSDFFLFYLFIYFTLIGFVVRSKKAILGKIK